MSGKALFALLLAVALGYGGLQKFRAKPPAGELAAQQGAWTGEGERLETSHPAFYGTQEPGGPVLRMKPEVLAQLQRIAPSKVVMFATSWCPYCAKARAVFEKNGVRYTELDLERDGQAKAFLENTMGMSGFPVTVIGNRVTAGFDEGQILASLKEI